MRKCSPALQWRSTSCFDCMRRPLRGDVSKQLLVPSSASGQFQDHPESWAASVATLNRNRLPLDNVGAIATSTPPTPSATGEP